MGLFLVVLDWILLTMTLFGEVFYLSRIFKEDEHSILMDMLKYLLLNDVISMPIVLLHDVPSYFLDFSLSDRVFLIKELGILSHCFPFFYSLLMLPVFALLNLVAIVAVYVFVTIRKNKISQVAICVCYGFAVLMSTPLVTEYCGFTYNSTTHYWHYDYSRPYTAVYQRVNWTAQIAAFAVVSICMTIVLLYLARQAKKMAMAVSPLVQSTGSQTQTLPNSQMTRMTHVGETRAPKLPRQPVRTRSVMDQAFAFIVLCLCFIAGTVSFNFFYCQNFACMTFTIVSSYASRAKWVIYCVLMRRTATISRLFRR